MAAVTDLRDVRVLIPRVRRAIDGPQATASGSVAATLTDDEMTGLIADAVGEIILLTGTLFGHELIASERDSFYLSPTAWIVEPALNESEGSVVAFQAAINYWWIRLSEFRSRETIKDEGQEWTVEFSANFVRDLLKLLANQRDKALEAVAGQAPALDVYVSWVANRDLAAARVVEPFVVEVGGPVPYSGGGGGGLELVG